MKVKKIFCILTMITMLAALLPSLPAAAYVDSTVRFKRVTSADDLVVGAKYLIVGYDADERIYYALGNETSDNNTLNTGRRSAIPMQKNTDDTLSLAEDYSKTIRPLAVRLGTYRTDGKYTFKNADDLLQYLSAFYSTVSSVNVFSDTKSKSLPIHIDRNGMSEWELKFGEDEKVLFKTTKTFDSGEQSAYIRFFHYVVKGDYSDSNAPAFSGGLISDSNIDLDGTGLTINDLTEDNMPVNTYLYKEVCTHDEAGLTHYGAKESTCSTRGNIEYYKCSNCCGYLLPDKKTEIKLADTVLQLEPHIITNVPAKEASCTEHGNIAYTKCEVCGKYFEGNSTDTEIDINDTYIPAINHSYADGVCSFCDAGLETSYFGSRNSGDGSQIIFTAEYNDKMYAMGMPNKKGMAAVGISQEANVFKASSDTAAFASIEYGSSETGGYDYGKQYIKIGLNYLKNDSGTLKVACMKENANYWKYEDGYMYDNTDGKKYICLVTNGEEPYFSVSDTIDANHIQAREYYEKCHHKDGLIHSPEVAPTCYTNGVREYWTCNVCDMYYSDSEGISEIENKDDVIMLALGAKDENGDDVCDYCHKKMPVFTKVTSADEIVMQNKYILVAKFGDDYYAMAPLISDSKDEKGGSSYSNLLPAVPITPLADGTFKYKEADDQNAFIFTTEFAAECCDMDNGEIRYSLQGTVDGKVSSLADQSGEFFMGDAYAKYGYRLGLNDDKTASIQSVYSKTWDNTDNGYMRFYYIDGQYGFSVLTQDMHKGNSIFEKKVYLYRMTENGTVANPEDKSQSVNYTLNDASSKRNFAILTGEAPTDAQNTAVDLSNVSGMAEALTQEAIDSALRSYVKDWSTQGAVKLDTGVNIEVTEYTEGDEKAGIGSSVKFSLTPTMTITDGADKETFNIDDASFNGSKLMNVSVYVGNMYPQEVIHIKQDGTKEYFYQSGHAKVESGEAKPFSVSESSAGKWVIFNVTEFSEVIVNSEESGDGAVFSIDYYNGWASINCSKDGEYNVVFVDYEENALNDVRLVPWKFNAGMNGVPKPKDMEISSGDKILLLEDVSNMRPLCGAYVIK